MFSEKPRTESFTTGLKSLVFYSSHPPAAQFLPESLHSLRPSEGEVMLLFSRLSLKRVDALSSPGRLEIIWLLSALALG